MPPITHRLGTIPREGEFTQAGKFLRLTFATIRDSGHPLAR
jgi:hypothetical protein